MEAPSIPAPIYNAPDDRASSDALSPELSDHRNGNRNPGNALSIEEIVRQRGACIIIQHVHDLINEASCVR